MINSSFVDRKLVYKGHRLLHLILSICMGEKWNKMSKFCLQLKVNVYDGDKFALMYYYILMRVLDCFVFTRYIV